MRTFIGMNCLFRRYHILILLLALSVVASCDSRQTAVTLNDVETYIQARPDSALATIRSIDTTTLTTRALRAHYALLHAIALDKNWIDTTDVKVVMPAVEYYDRHPSGIRRAKAWYYLGRIQQNGENRLDASISFLKAERYSEHSEDSDFKGLVCLAMSTLYSQTHLHEEALKYSERAYSFFVEARDTTNTNSALYCKASDLMNLERYGEADTLFRILIKNESVHPNLRTSLLCNYALNLMFFQEDYEQAVHIFEKAITTSGSLKNRNSWCAYAYSLMRVGRVKRADSIFAQLEATKGNAYLSYSYWKSMADAYSLDYPAAFGHLKTAYDIQDENVVIAFRQSAVKAQKDFLDEMNRESKKEAEHRQLVMGVAIASLIILILLIVFVFKRMNDRSFHEKESLIETYRELTSRTEEEKAKVRNQYIQLCRSHFSHIGRINEMLSVYSKESNNNLYKELKRSIQRVGLDEDSQQRFEKMLDDSFDGVMTHFRDSFPGKKERFYQLVSYLFAGFGTTTICTIIPGYNKHNIHVEKWRLKQLIQDSECSYKKQFLEMLA